MPKQKMAGIMVNGSVRTAGVTFYTKNGKTVVRSSHSVQPKRRTRAQFEVRMRIRHTMALWQMLRGKDPMFTGGKSVFARFASLASRLPVVYLCDNAEQSGASLLLPGMPVSDGTLPVVEQRLGEVGGMAALLTDLRRDSLADGDTLRLYTLQQSVEQDKPHVRIDMREVTLAEFVEVDGCLALMGDAFADDMAGWALVRINGDRCSSQSVVTRSTYYERFTTDEALRAAADSYGGLTELNL